MPATPSDTDSMDRAVHHLLTNHMSKGGRTGWVILASIFVEAWDLYAIGFVLIYINQEFNPGPLVLGLAAAATQGGALVGSLLGGYLADKLGRRAMFLSTMAIFIVLAIAQALAPSMLFLIAVRFLLGIPLGSEPAIGFSYIMEAMKKNKRELMGSRWQFIFAMGSVLAVSTVTFLIILNVNDGFLWRLMLGLGALPAAIILIARYRMPESVVWEIHQGKFRRAKAASLKMYGDSLEMLPDHDVPVERARLGAFFADLKTDPIRRRASIYSWIANFFGTAEFQTFGFYLPLLFVSLGVSTAVGNNSILIVLYLIAAFAGFIAPSIVKRVGHRGVGIIGFAIVFVMLVVAAWALFTNHIFIVPIAAGVMIWGEYLATSNPMTIATVVAKPQYRGVAGGVSYFFNKLAGFLAIFFFPSITAGLGQAGATLLVSSFALIGLLSAIFILPEVFGFEGDVNRPDRAGLLAKR
jgi:MFS family permease